jgi:nucleoside-diphosphate-sugar epimerase
VRALARSDASAKRVADLGAEPVSGDLADRETIAAGAEGCDTAFHLAAHLGEWGPWEEFERGNVEGTRNALDGCAEAVVWGKGDPTLLPELVETIEKGQFAWIGGGRT